MHLAHEENPHTDQEQHREPGNKDISKQRLLFRGFGFDAHTVFQQIIHQPDIVRRIGHETGAILFLAAHGIAVDLHFGDLFAFYLLHECREVHGGRRCALTSELRKQAHENQPDDEPDGDGFKGVIQCNFLGFMERVGIILTLNPPAG